MCRLGPSITRTPHEPLKSVENKQLFEATGDDAHLPRRKAGSDLSVDNGSNNSNCSNDSY